MPLTILLTLTAVRTALTAPGTGRHRRTRWHRRTGAAVRFVLGIPGPDQRHHAAHTRRRCAAA